MLYVAAVESATLGHWVRAPWPTPHHPRTAPHSVLAAEALLSTLEACGIDNARIEIEGGSEVPIIDGSAMGWAVELRSVGVRPSGPQTSRAVWLSPPQPLTVGDGEAFITYYPGDVMKLSAGVEFEVSAGSRMGPCGGGHQSRAAQPFSWSTIMCTAPQRGRPLPESHPTPPPPSLRRPPLGGSGTRGAQTKTSTSGMRSRRRAAASTPWRRWRR